MVQQQQQPPEPKPQPPSQQEKSLSEKVREVNRQSVFNAQLRGGR
ncbi:hypothetical protein [Streptomyces sp. 6N223]